MKRIATTAFVALTALTLMACDGGKGEAADPYADEHAAMKKKDAPTNRIDIPAAVRKNLGITFAKVERRTITQAMYIPGVVEAVGNARHAFKLPGNARIFAKVAEYQRVAKGDTIFEAELLDLPDLKSAILAAQSALDDAEAGLALAKENEERLKEILEKHKALMSGASALYQRTAAYRDSLDLEEELREARIKELEELQKAGGGQAAALADARIAFAQNHSAIKEADVELAQAEQNIGELKKESADLESQQRAAKSTTLMREAQLANAKASVAAALDKLASVTGHSVDDLIGEDNDGLPLWKRLRRLTLNAPIDGVVTQLDYDHGAIAEEGEVIAIVADPHAVRVRALAKQSHMPVIQSKDYIAMIKLPDTSADAVPASLQFGVQGDTHQRLIDLIAIPEAQPSWMMAGVAVNVEITPVPRKEDEDKTVLAIPTECVIQDGLKKIIFMRDPENKDKVIRMEADLGQSDGKWVQLRSGVIAGDEIVLNGVYELKLTGQGDAPKGGHFHADGTWHEGEH